MCRFLTAHTHKGQKREKQTKERNEVHDEVVQYRIADRPSESLLFSFANDEKIIDPTRSIAAARVTTKSAGLASD